MSNLHLGWSIRLKGVDFSAPFSCITFLVIIMGNAHYFKKFPPSTVNDLDNILQMAPQTLEFHKVFGQFLSGYFARSQGISFFIIIIALIDHHSQS